MEDKKKGIEMVHPALPGRTIKALDHKQESVFELSGWVRKGGATSATADKKETGS